MFYEIRGAKLPVTQDAEPLFLMEQEQLFQAVDERDINQIFLADAADGQPLMEVVGKDHKDHGEGVRKVRNDKIRQECVGLSAGALDAWDL